MDLKTNQKILIVQLFHIPSLGRPLNSLFHMQIELPCFGIPTVPGISFTILIMGQKYDHRPIG